VREGDVPRGRVDEYGKSGWPVLDAPPATDETDRPETDGERGCIAVRETKGEREVKPNGLDVTPFPSVGLKMAEAEVGDRGCASWKDDIEPTRPFRRGEGDRRCCWVSEADENAGEAARECRPRLAAVRKEGPAPLPFVDALFGRTSVECAERPPAAACPPASVERADKEDDDERPPTGCDCCPATLACATL
jgi:hypothetical protein